MSVAERKITAFKILMAKLESFYPALRDHRQHNTHNDPHFCEGCVYLMRWTTDRVIPF